MANAEKDQRGVFGVLVAILTGVLLLPNLPFSAPKSTPSPTAGTATERPVTPPPDDAAAGLDAPFQNYLGSTAEGDDLAAELAMHDREVTTMVMCVADPDASSLAYRTDLQIDTLQRALMPQQFVLDRCHLPWIRTGKATRPRGAPGLLLFRHAGSDAGADAGRAGRLLAVYLVGEVMTAGVDKAALVEALRHADRFTTSRCRSIPVLGPVFTGSADSLAIAITAWWESTRAAASPDRSPPWIVNFSALGFDEPRFRRVLGDVACDVTDATVRFTAQREMLLEYVAGKGYRRLAWLLESGSGFAAGRILDGSELVEKQYVFPAGLSQLRDATMNPQAKNSRLIASPTDRMTFYFPGESRTGAVDLLAGIAPGMRAAYAELALRRILSDIAERDYDAVGITCTDDRDRMFLVEQLRRHAPGVQILLVGGDLAHEHPIHRQSMLGALVASGSPPGVLRQADSTGTTSMFALSADATYSLFEAVQLVVGPACDGCEAKHPHALGLSSWISIIGYQGAWPVETHAAAGGGLPPRLVSGGFREALGRNPSGLGAITLLIVALSLYGSGLIRGWFSGPSRAERSDHASATPRHGAHDVAALSTERPFTGSGADRRCRPAWAAEFVLVALLIPATNLAIVSTGALQHGNQVMEFGRLKGWSWLFVSAALLAPWGVPACMRGLPRMIPALAYLGMWTFVPSDQRLLAITASLALVASIHGLANILLLAWQRRRPARPSPAVDSLLTAAACVIQVLLVAFFARGLACEETQPWLFTCAWVLNGVSPVMTITTASLAVAAIWCTELMRSRAADPRTAAVGPGDAPACADGDAAAGSRRPDPGCTEPFLPRVVAWFGSEPGVDAQGGLPRIATMRHVAWFFVSLCWLLFLASRLRPVYPSLVSHRVCVGMIVAGYLSWCFVLVRIATLVDGFLERLDGFGREIAARAPLAAAFANSPPDPYLGRFLYASPSLRGIPESESPDAETPRMLEIKQFVRSVGAELRTGAGALFVGATLLFVAATSFPCQPHRWLILTAILSFMAIAYVFVRTLVRIDANSVLSRIAGTTPGKVQWDWTLVTRVAFVAGIPILLLVGEAFPDLWAWVAAAFEG